MTGSRLIALSLLLILAVSLCPAQDQKQLANLKALFEKDPAAGFVEAERLFEKPKREGDLEGMVGIIRVVAEWGYQCNYSPPLERMASAALPVAPVAGNWSAVGDICHARVRARSIWPIAWQRQLRLVQLATLWPVADESTKALMTAFYENLKTAPSIEEALRLAQASLAAQRETSHPFVWAGFVAVRGPE